MNGIAWICGASTAARAWLVILDLKLGKFTRADAGQIHHEPASRHPLELLEVRLPLLDEGVFALLGFFAHVVEECGVSGEVEQAHLAIAIGIEGGFEAT